MADMETVRRAFARMSIDPSRSKPKVKKPQAKRPGFREAVEWIATEDDCDIGDVECGYIVTIVMVAHLFGKTQDEVAKSVSSYRARHGITDSSPVCDHG